MLRAYDLFVHRNAGVAPEAKYNGNDSLITVSLHYTPFSSRDYDLILQTAPSSTDTMALLCQLSLL